MRVVLVHTDPWLSASPGVTFTAMTAAGIAAAGEAADPAAGFRTYFACEPPPGLTIHLVAAPGRRAFLAGAARILDALPGGPRVLWVRHALVLGWALGERQAGRAKAVVFEAHNWFWAPWQRDDVSLWSTWKSCWRERRHVPHANALVCLHDVQATVWRRSLGSRVPIHTIPGGHPEAIPLAAPVIPALGYIGSLEARKGVERLAPLARALGWPVVLVGGRDAAEAASVRAAFAAAGVAETQVTITGWVDRTAMRTHLARVAWGCVPLPDQFFNRHLTEPMKIRDLLAHGIPVAASDLPSVRSILGQDAGILVDFANPEATATQLRAAQLDAARYRAAALATAQAWTWCHRGARIRELVAGL